MNLSWKTTLFGILAVVPGVIQAIQPILPDSWVPVLSSIATGIALYFAKDKDKTGATG